MQHTNSQSCACAYINLNQILVLLLTKNTPIFNSVSPSALYTGWSQKVTPRWYLSFHAC